MRLNLVSQYIFQKIGSIFQIVCEVYFALTVSYIKVSCFKINALGKESYKL